MMCFPMSTKVMNIKRTTTKDPTRSRSSAAAEERKSRSRGPLRLLSTLATTGHWASSCKFTQLFSSLGWGTGDPTSSHKVILIPQNPRLVRELPDEEHALLLGTFTGQVHRVPFSAHHHSLPLKDGWELNWIGKKELQCFCPLPPRPTLCVFPSAHFAPSAAGPQV